MFSSIEIRRHSLHEPWRFNDLLKREEEVISEIQNQKPGRILLSELAPVVTLGRRDAGASVLVSDEAFRTNGIDLVAVKRGGLATYHGPGQWVLFCVENLEKLTGDSRGVRRAVSLLLDSTLDIVRKYEPLAEIREGEELGIWCSRGKLAALGISIQKGVLTHGVSLNCLRTPQSFFGINPCGLKAPVAYLFESEAFQVGSDSAGRDLDAEFKRIGSSWVECLLTRITQRGYT